ncbi:hypothetical protein DX908_14265 [Parvularcula marina]|uniref:Uncharacterized protein n=1 Tax=Parvularcula marina TaxID=2292771 RepID=A0A371R7P5_9PROT|nr:hypothetical protein DX908_14265 [Parvularcula marina]
MCTQSIWPKRGAAKCDAVVLGLDIGLTVPGRADVIVHRLIEEPVREVSIIRVGGQQDIGTGIGFDPCAGQFSAKDVHVPYSSGLPRNDR